MTIKYVNPIANGVRNFDSKTHPLANYMYFGWEGLVSEGEIRGSITRSQYNEYIRLAQVPLNEYRPYGKLLPPKIRGDLAPGLGFPFYYGRMIGVGPQPFHSSAYQVKKGLVLVRFL